MRTKKEHVHLKQQVEFKKKIKKLKLVIFAALKLLATDAYICPAESEL